MKIEPQTQFSRTAIPRTLHFIWVGDESKRPDNCIDTWRALNPGWEIKLWGNASLAETEWVNGAHMAEMAKRELNGVADMMRWEILYNEGGVVVDADSICVRPLDDELLECEAFACWESEMARPGLIAAGYFGAHKGNPFVGQIILDIRDEPTVCHDMAWKTVGPQRLTDSYRKYHYHPLRIYPSHYFIPEHFSGIAYDGDGPVYAHQFWGSTRQSYDELHRLRIGDAPVPAAAEERDGADGAGSVAAAPAAAVSSASAAGDAAAAPVPPVVAPAPVAAPAARSPLQDLHDPYFVQEVPVSADLVGVDRLSVLAKLCAGQRVLHVGCADWPITDPRTSLHVALEPVCAQLDGFDVQEEAMAALAPYVKGRLTSRLEELTGEYDIVLVPEVMEHVGNVETFLKQLDAIDTSAYLLSVPDAYQCRNRHFDYVRETGTFVEVVHPDHNCWYTPYTFRNTIAKYTSWQPGTMWFFNNISLLGLFLKA